MQIHLKIFATIFLALLATNQMNAQNSIETHKDSLCSVVIKYYDLNLKIFQENSTVEDINPHYSQDLYFG